MCDAAVADVPTSGAREGGVVERVRDLARTKLAPLVTAIDRDGVYPEGVLRALGGAGAYATHVAGVDIGRPDLRTAIQAMSAVSELCLSTAFCMWCQDALAWYIATSDNMELQAALGGRVAAGELLGGTGLSNPMKNLFGIERLRLKARRVDNGYVVNGALPWVSNLGSDHHFGAVFELEERPELRVMAVIDCAGPGVSIAQNAEFVALDGTRTFSVQFRDALVPDQRVLAAPIDNYIPRIRSGFILLQSGMSFGLIRNCIALMRQEQGRLAHVNRYLEMQPDDFEAALAALEDEVWTLSQTPLDTAPAYFRRVVEARLAAGEMAVRAAHFAMLHQGAKGYVSTGTAQRRLREAYFVAIVTPATKQLRKMLAEMKA